MFKSATKQNHFFELSKNILNVYNTSTDIFVNNLQIVLGAFAREYIAQ